MGVINPRDGCVYVYNSERDKFVKHTNADGTKTNFGKQYYIDFLFRIISKLEYGSQTCLLVTGDDYQTHLEDLRNFYAHLSDLKLNNELDEYSMIEVQKNKLVGKLIRGFVNSNFEEKFAEDLRRLDRILLSIHPE